MTLLMKEFFISVLFLSVEKSLRCNALGRELGAWAGMRVGEVGSFILQKIGVWSLLTRLCPVEASVNSFNWNFRHRKWSIW